MEMELMDTSLFATSSNEEFDEERDFVITEPIDNSNTLKFDDPFKIQKKILYSKIFQYLDFKDLLNLSEVKIE